MNPPAPQVLQGVLDDATLDRYFADLGVAAEILGIGVKSAARTMAGSGPGPTLAEARTLLRERTVLGVQIRYRLQGEEWCDTLIVQPEGTRLVRLRRDA